MRVYILTDDDFKELMTNIDRDPKWGTKGGSSQVLSQVECQAHEDAHAFYNYQLRTWITKVTGPKT
jgi:hypothetical protein